MRPPVLHGLRHAPATLMSSIKCIPKKEIRRTLVLKPWPSLSAKQKKTRRKDHVRLLVEKEWQNHWHDGMPLDYKVTRYRMILEDTLGYEFASKNLSFLMSETSDGVGMAMLGASAIQLAMLDVYKRRKLRNSTLKNFAETVGLYRTGGSGKDLASKEDVANDLFGELPRTGLEAGHYKIPMPHLIEKKINPAVLDFLRIFGAIFRADGMKAVKKVLDRIMLLKDAPDYPTQLNELGIAAHELIMTNAYFNRATSDQIARYNTIRCSKEWHRTIISNSEVLQFVCTYLETDGVKRGVELDQKLQIEKHLSGTKNLQEGAPNSYLTYQIFLGTVYRNGGIDLVTEMLRRHDPGFVKQDSEWLVTKPV